MEDKFDTPCCPLCSSLDIAPFFADRRRAYLRCCECKLVFVPQCYWLCIEDEKAIYDLHENDAEDQGYRQFLSRLSHPLLERLGPNKQRGLDFGCGPGPALSHLLEEQGHQMDLYDPLYFNDPSVLSNRYDFICSTEVVEHMHDPNKDWDRLFKMLNRGGWLGIMTKLVIDKQAFSRWHYIHDMTHICFYSRETFDYLAQRFKAELNFVANDVMLFKSEDAGS
ncbi:MAG: class I SAM-dependent methyltransferase [Candidatus Polarisedimenticolaceae bacterium]|nr:class I SAM-dependent methyltransferase [Candidatus Polarisedimenticolaceae bacterium]